MPTSCRAASLADLADWLAGSSEPERWRLVAEFLEEYRHEPPGIQSRLLESEPAGTGDERWDVFLGALAEHLAALADQAPPQWACRRMLRSFWFPFDTRAARRRPGERAGSVPSARGVHRAAGVGGRVSEGPLLDREGIRGALTRLGERLARRGLTADVYVFGGAAMAPACDARRVTLDIDVSFEPHEEVEEARAVTDDLLLPH